MAKKSFRGVDAILGGIDQNDPGITRNGSINDRLHKEQGNKNHPRDETETSKGSSDVRSTMIFNAYHLDRLRALAYWERKSMKSVLEDALSSYFGLKGEDYVEKALTCWGSQQK